MSIKEYFIIIPSQQVAKRSVSLKTFSKFYDRPLPSSPKEIPKIENDEKEINHVRSKSEDDDESVSSVTSAKRPYMPNHVEEEEPKMDNLVSGGKIEHLQPIYSAVSVISMEDEEFESDNEKVWVCFLFSWKLFILRSKVPMNIARKLEA